LKAQSSVWLEIATDDIDAAEHCFNGKNYLWALFMCQQAVEKAIKAYYFEKTGEIPPKKHDLISLAGAANILNEIDDKSQDLLRRLSIYYLETRYPDKRKDLELKCTHEYTGELLAATKGVIEWLKNKLR